MADRAIALIDCNHQLAVSVVGAGIDRGLERLSDSRSSSPNSSMKSVRLMFREEAARAAGWV